MDELVRQHLVQMNSALQSLISAFILWYTAFWTVNLLAFGWIFAKTTGGEHQRSIQIVISRVFAFANAAGVVVSLFLWRAIDRKSSAMAELTRAAERHLERNNDLHNNGTVLRILFDNVYDECFVGVSLLLCGVTLSILTWVWLWLGNNSMRTASVNSSIYRLWRSYRQQ